MSQSSNDSSFFDKAGQWLSHSITLRLFVIGILVLIMLIPVSLIEKLIYERQTRHRQVQDEISQTWGYPQTVSGLVLSVPVDEYVTVSRGKDEKETMVTTSYFHILPESLHVRGALETEKRTRGIFETMVYSTQMKLEGEFQLSPEMWAKKENMRWDEAVVSLGITDLRSIRESVTIEWDGAPHSFSPGLPTNDVFQSGISVPVEVPAIDSDAQLKLHFSVDLDFRGSDYIHFVPLGKTTTVELHSPWKDPSFGGAFLPHDHTVTDEGFDATWRVINLNRSYPQHFQGSVQGINESAFGVTLLLPVDHYRKSTRAAKYAVLFIVLTFVVFFFIQIMAKVRIHPVQYILVGFALCMFYTLLISLSEHLAFGTSFFIAAAAVVLLVTFYAQGTFRNMKLTGVLGGIMSLLYAFIFIIIQMQDFALLVGSVGLFAALAAIMYVTRGIDWYDSAQFTSKGRGGKNPPS